MNERWTRRRLLLAGGAAVTIGTAGCLDDSEKTGSTGGGEWHVDDPLAVSDVTQYNSPGCRCCERYGSYLQENVEGGVTETVPDDIVAVKREHGVPAEVESCHTLDVGGYVVEGHVPAAAIATLLEESPPIDGIALPGMPAGSPGMGGEKSDPFTIRTFSGGSVGDVFVEF